MYERDFGFDFASFTPAELFGRIRGALRHRSGSLAALRWLERLHSIYGS